MTADRDRAHGGGDKGKVQPVNCFALVAYLAEPLGSFVDWIRRDLEPGSLAPRPHLTILPPRQLAPGAFVQEAKAQLASDLASVTADEVRLGDIEIFPSTSVVYIAVDGGFDRLKQTYRRLNRGALAFTEEYPYHPHITLAQGLDRGEAEVIARAAAMRWRSFGDARRVPIQRLTLVQCQTDGRWRDLKGYRL